MVALEAKGWREWYAAIFGQAFVDALDGEGEFHHSEAIGWHWVARQALLRGERPPDDYYAYFPIWARGNLKTTILRALVLADACLSITAGVGSYALIVGGTKKKARGTSVTINQELKNNQKLREYYPELAEVMRNPQGASEGWTADFIYTKSGCVFHFIGLDEGVAGANISNIRPTLIAPDDIDSREDSPVIAESRFQTFTREVLPTRQANTLVFWAQNLISRYSVMYRIQKGRARVLTNRKPTEPVPAVRDLVTETRTVNQIVKDVYVQGKPTWRGWDRQRIQDEIDTYGLEAFLAECQHEVEQQKAGLILPEWDEAVHLITWEEFRAVYGVDDIPSNWRKYIGHDWGNTHPCVVSCVATAASNTRLPGLHFLFAGLTFPQNTLPDDVAVGVINRLAPEINTTSLNRLDPAQIARHARGRVTDILNAPREIAAERIREQVLKWLKDDTSYVMWHMSHEQKTIRTTYQGVFGLPFQACNPGAEGGIDQIRHFLRVDYSQPHPFKVGKKGLAGFYFIVDRDQLEEARDDYGLKLWREQLPEWVWRQMGLTETGLKKDKPVKVHDDAGNSLMMLFKHFTLSPTPLNVAESIEMKVPIKQGQIAEISDPIQQQQAAQSREFWLNYYRADEIKSQEETRRGMPSVPRMPKLPRRG